MFGIGTTEILIILVVALIVIGPKKLPELASTLGKALGEFRRMSSDVKRTIDLEADRAEEAARTREAQQELYGKNETPEKETSPVEILDAEEKAEEEAREDAPEDTKKDIEDNDQRSQTTDSGVTTDKEG
ncbi:MAG: twin-arginine translocase subunit TatB [Deltaproteobacteria bacterium]|nr:MAG: twin-arginine translocase subunit TatB [Deltaproteobacteria bacterium]